jgi:hypothetical protein
MEMTKDVPIETIPRSSPEEAVDAEVAKIEREKQSASDGFDGADGVCSGTSDGGDQEERIEV